MRSADNREAGVHARFYEALGALFYAIAFADGSVHPRETSKLRNLVEKEWVGQEPLDDQFGTNTSRTIEFAFDWLQAESRSAEQCMSVFSNYCKSKQQPLSKEQKTLIWKTASAVAAAYAGRNKSELVMLERLRAVLN